MNKNMVFASVVVVVIIVVAVVGVYVLMNGGKGGGGGDIFVVANATSLQYNSEMSYQGAASNLFNCAAKNIGAADMVLRIDILEGAGGNYTYILDRGAQTAWVSSNGTWANLSSDFINQWSMWVGSGKHWTADLGRLSTNWSGTGDYTYTNSTTGTTIRYYNVIINPSLADSLFQPNT